MEIFTVDSGRFRINAHAGKGEIYDSKKPVKDAVGREVAFHRIEGASSFTDIEVYRLALVWLRNNQLIKPDVFEKAATASFAETHQTQPAPSVKSTTADPVHKNVQPGATAGRAKSQ